MGINRDTRPLNLSRISMSHQRELMKSSRFYRQPPEGGGLARLEPERATPGTFLINQVTTVTLLETSDLERQGE